MNEKNEHVEQQITAKTTQQFLDGLASYCKAAGMKNIITPSSLLHAYKMAWEGCGIMTSTHQSRVHEGSTILRTCALQMLTESAFMAMPSKEAIHWNVYYSWLNCVYHYGGTPLEAELAVMWYRENTFHNLSGVASSRQYLYPEISTFLLCTRGIYEAFTLYSNSARLPTLVWILSSCLL